MKKIGILTLAMFLSHTLMANVTVGKVDIQKVLVTIDEGQSVKNKLKDTFEKKQKELKSEEDKIKDQQDKFQKQTAALSDKAKQKKQTEIQESIMKLQQKSMDYQKEMQELEQNYKRPIIDKITKLVEEVSEKAGVDVTFEVNTTPLVYVKNSKDITDDVIKAYNKQHPAK
jgi:outer membrane protein